MSNSSQTLTKEQTIQIELKIKEQIKKEEEIQKAVKNDTKGFKTMEEACQFLLQPENNKDDEKDNNNHTNKLKNLWQTFQETAQQISEFAHEFLESLRNEKGIKLDTKKELRTRCKEFKELLFETSKVLQKYRLEIKKMINTFDTILELLTPPKEIFDELAKLSKDQRLREVEGYATANKDVLSEKLSNLSENMEKSKSSKSLEDLSEKWKTLQTNLEETTQKIDKQLEEFRKKVSKMSGVAWFFVAVLGVAAVVATGGAAALAAAIGITSTVIVFSLGAIAFSGLAAFGIYLLKRPKLAEELDLARNKSVQAIRNGLKNISKQGDAMESMLKILYHEWVDKMSQEGLELNYNGWIKRVKLEGLFRKMNETRTSLEILKKNIKDTEDVCLEQLSTYTDKVYKPLLSLF